MQSLPAQAIDYGETTGNMISIFSDKFPDTNKIKKRKSPVSWSFRAGLIFPIRRTKRWLKYELHNTNKIRIGIGAAIYLSMYDGIQLKILFCISLVLIEYYFFSFCPRIFDC